MVSIAVSYLVMILSVAISSGFREELRRAISLLSGDIRMDQPGWNYTSDPAPLRTDASYLEQVRAIRGVSVIRPVVYTAGIVKAGEDICGVLFKGVEGYDSLRVAIPAELADKLRIGEGDPLTAYFVGEKVKARRFTIREVYGRGKEDDLYRTVLTGSPTLVVYAGLSDLQRLAGWAAEEVSTLEIELDPKWRGQSEALAEEVGFVSSTYAAPQETIPVVTSSRRRFAQIYSWLDLIDFNVVILLLLMTVVAGFNMISGLLILLFRKTSTIGTLKSLGMTDRAIAGVFLRVSSRHVLKGMALGNALALLLCLVQSQTHFLRLNPENYMLSYVPVHLDLPMVLAADFLSWVVIMLLLLIPSLFISRVDPAKTVRAQ